MNAAELLSLTRRLWTGVEGEDMVVCLPRDPRDPYSVRVACIPLGGFSVTSRRRFLAQVSGAFAGALILPVLLEGQSLGADEKAFVSEGIDPAEL